MMRALAREAGDDLSLAARLHARIAKSGPLSVEAFMQACLSDAASGAYTSRQPIGGAGDFITAPEISQIFGELIGLWAVAVWQSMGEPRGLTVAELGPGRGALMADALRAWRGVPKVLDAVSVTLIETSRVMAEAQRNTLREAPLPVRWHARLDELPDGPLIVLANEFIDALPVRQFIRRDGAWHERLVAGDGRGGFASPKAKLTPGDQACDLLTRRRMVPSSKRGPRRRPSCVNLLAAPLSPPLPLSSSITVTTKPASATRCKPCAAIALPHRSPIRKRRSLRACRFRRSEAAGERARTAALRPDAARRVPAQARPWRAPQSPAPARYPGASRSDRFRRIAARRSQADGRAIQVLALTNAGLARHHLSAQSI